MRTTFSINRYDRDGDIMDEGIFLHFDNNLSILIGNTINDLQKFIYDIKDIKKEIEENYLIGEKGEII